MLASFSHARGAIVAIYQFSKISTSNMKLKPRWAVHFSDVLSSLFHKKGPRYLRECLPYNTELHLGI